MATKRRILVVDIGGTNVKLLMSAREQRHFPSGESLGPRQFVAKIRETVGDWKFDAVSIGFPSPVRNGRIVRDPKHLAKGWSKFNFTRALRKPTHVINDAAMQALGSYHGRRMLFLGLGTGLGSALIWEKNLLPLELGDFPYEGGIIENVLGKVGFDSLGKKEWTRHVLFCLKHLKLSFIADYVVVGGGLIHELGPLPEGFERGDNRNTYLGGLRLWEFD